MGYLPSDRVGRVALEQNMAVAEQTVTEEDLALLGV
jgi:hypothetical protein